MNGVVIGGSSSGSGTPAVVEITATDTAPAGSLLVVAIGDGFGYSTTEPIVTGVTDSKGNSYTSVLNDAEVGGASDLAVYISVLDTEIVPDDTITITGATSWTTYQSVAVAYDVGLVLDQIGTAVGQSASGTLTSVASCTEGDALIGVSITNARSDQIIMGGDGTWAGDYFDDDDTQTMFIGHAEPGLPAGNANFTAQVSVDGEYSSAFSMSVKSSEPTVRPGGIASEAAVGHPAVTGGTPLIKPPGIPSSGGVGAPTMRVGAVVEPVGIPAEAARFGVPLTAADGVFPIGIPATDEFGVPTITQGLPPGPTPAPPLVRVPLVQNNSRYKFIITDMMGNVQGEVLNCSNKEFIQGLDNMQTAKFTAKITNPLVDYIMNNDCLCKCYRQPVNRNLQYQLLLVGDVITDEESTSGETGTVTFTVTDPLQRLMYRLLGKEVDSRNHGTGFSVGTPDNPSNIVDIVSAMLREVNEDPKLGHCGVGMGTRSPNTPDAFLAPVYFQPFATQLAVYTAALDGLDFWMMPCEPYSLAAYPPTPGHHPFLTGGPPLGTPVDEIVKGTSVEDTIIARLNLYWPVGNYLVSAGPPPVYSRNHPFPVFEYGTGKRNLQGYRRVRDKSQLVNLWHNLPDGFPSTNHTNDPVVTTQTNTVTSEGTVQTSINRRGGWESVDPTDLGSEQPQGPIIGGGGGASLQEQLSRMSPQDALKTALTVRSMRQQLVNTEAQVTAVPRQQIQFTPTINSDTDWTVDYFVGDIVTVRSYIQETGSWRFDGTCRIYGVDAAIDDNEQEQITVTTVPANAAVL